MTRAVKPEKEPIPKVLASDRRGSAKARSGRDFLLVLPLAGWGALFLALPSLMFFAYSFWRIELFAIVPDWGLQNYAEILGSGHGYWHIIVNSLWVGLTTAALTCVLAFLLAWAVRFHFPRHANVIVLAIVVSSVGSYLARLFSWRSILGGNGLIAYFTSSLGLGTGLGEALIFNRGTIILVLTNLFLPFAFLPIYANLLTVEREVLEASRMLGAGPLRTFVRVALPLSAAGLTTSLIYVFVFASGDFAVAAFLGGPQGTVVARAIGDLFITTLNWPLGAALTIVYVVVLAAFVGPLAWFAARTARRIR